MEAIQIKAIFYTIVMGIGGFASWFVGGMSKDLRALIILMSVDFIMGVLIAIFWKKSNKSEGGGVSSVSAWKGLCRKGVSLLIIGAGFQIDVALGTDYIRTAVVFGFLANELISIIENAAVMGVPMPQALKTALEVLKAKGDGLDEKTE